MRYRRKIYEVETKKIAKVRRRKAGDDYSIVCYCILEDGQEKTLLRKMRSRDMLSREPHAGDYWATSGDREWPISQYFIAHDYEHISDLQQIGERGETITHESIIRAIEEIKKYIVVPKNLPNKRRK